MMGGGVEALVVMRSGFKHSGCAPEWGQVTNPEILKITSKLLMMPKRVSGF
jgi:hypothetical protein